MWAMREGGIGAPVAAAKKESQTHAPQLSYATPSTGAFESLMAA